MLRLASVEKVTETSWSCWPTYVGPYSDSRTRRIQGKEERRGVGRGRMEVGRNGLVLLTWGLNWM